MHHKEIELVSQSCDVVVMFEAMLREQESLNLLYAFHRHVWRQHVIYFLIVLHLFHHFLSYLDNAEQLCNPVSTKVFICKIIDVLTPLMPQDFEYGTIVQIHSIITYRICLQHRLTAAPLLLLYFAITVW